MKKVGILTFHRAINYGAVLQTYALYKTVQKMDSKVEVIDYRCDLIENYYYHVFSKHNSVKQNIKNLLFCVKQKKRNKAFEKFREEYLPLSDKAYYMNSDKTKLQDDYSCFFVGSDQVWNYPCINGDKTFLLDFVTDKNKKNSYAASLGKMNDEQIKLMEFEKYIEDFNNISIREQDGINLIQKLTGKEARMDLDPTLLLTADDWKKVASDVDIKDYLLVYSVNLPQHVYNEAKRIAKEKNLKLVVITLENKYKAADGEIDKSQCSPNEFLGYFFNADYIITNSFHGTVFSIIANKPFNTIKNGKNGLDNSRLETLLQRLQLDSKLVDTVSDIQNIDYNIINRLLEDYKKESLKYIEETIKK